MFSPTPLSLLGVNTHWNEHKVVELLCFWDCSPGDVVSTPSLFCLLLEAAVRVFLPSRVLLLGEWLNGSAVASVVAQIEFTSAEVHSPPSSVTSQRGVLYLWNANKDFLFCFVLLDCSRKQSVGQLLNWLNISWSPCTLTLTPHCLFFIIIYFILEGFLPLVITTLSHSDKFKYKMIILYYILYETQIAQPPYCRFVRMHITYSLLSWSELYYVDRTFPTHLFVNSFLFQFIPQMQSGLEALRVAILHRW